MSLAEPTASHASGVVLRGALKPRYEEILTRAALAFIAGLHRRLEGCRHELLARRRAGRPNWTQANCLTRDWKVAAISSDLLDRRVEIAGPVDRKMIVNALNSGAKVFMADFEDAPRRPETTPSRSSSTSRDRWGGTIDFNDLGNGRQRRLKSDVCAAANYP
jgi:malate synthase